MKKQQLLRLIHKNHFFLLKKEKKEKEKRKEKKKKNIQHKISFQVNFFDFLIFFLKKKKKYKLKKTVTTIFCFNNFKHHSISKKRNLSVSSQVKGIVSLPGSTSG